MTSSGLIKLTGSTISAASIRGGTLILELDGGGRVKVSGDNITVVEDKT